MSDHTETTDWQPISTVPTDGTPVLLWLGAQCALVCAFVNLAGSGGRLSPEWVLVREDGKPAEEDYGDVMRPYGQPTYWMQLPEPPHAKQELDARHARQIGLIDGIVSDYENALRDLGDE